jgi:hypothetical protein
MVSVSGGHADSLWGSFVRVLSGSEYLSGEARNSVRLALASIAHPKVGHVLKVTIPLPGEDRER